MLYRQILRVVGAFLLGFAFTFLIPLIYALYLQSYPIVEAVHSPRDAFAFFMSFFVCGGVGALFSLIGRVQQGALYRREGLASVVIIWVLAPAMAALPFLFSGTLHNPFQAYFEATSGLTTTGASVISAKQYDPETHQEIPYKQEVKGVLDTLYIYYGNIEPLRNADGTIIKEGIEAVSHPLLLWRSFIQWLGGGGIVVLFVAILPALGVGGKMLYYTETSGPLKETITPRVKETAVVLWKIYGVFTLLQIGLLLATNAQMTLFDAINITFATLSTGGFSIHNSGIGFYHNANTEWVIIAFMFIGSLNFSLFFYCFRGKLYRLFDPELIVYTLCILAAGLFITFQILGTQRYLLTTDEAGGIFGFSDALRTAFFQSVSAQTSTGFSSVNYDTWPYAAQVILLIVLYLGGMSGSTSSGIKAIRLILLFRIAQHKIESMFQPERVRTFKIGEKEVTDSVTIGVLCFFLIIVTMSALGVFFLSLDGIDLQTALTIVAATINDAGFGFREAGPLNSYAFLSNFSLTITSILMILGRLEFFAVLVILVPNFWRQK